MITTETGKETTPMPQLTLKLQAQIAAFSASRMDDRNARERSLRWPDPLKLSGAATVTDLEEESQVPSYSLLVLRPT
jgi:hypothetical protein